MYRWGQDAEYIVCEIARRVGQNAEYIDREIDRRVCHHSVLPECIGLHGHSMESVCVHRELLSG